MACGATCGAVVLVALVGQLGEDGGTAAPEPAPVRPVRGPAGPPLGGVAGRVVLSGQPSAAGVKVQVEGTALSLNTGPDGVFRFAEVPAGHHRLLAQCPGFVSADTELDKQDGAVVELTAPITLYTLADYPWDRTGGLVISTRPDKADLQLVNPRGEVTEARAPFRLPRAMVGMWTVRARAAGARDTERTVVVDDDENVKVQVLLPSLKGALADGACPAGMRTLEAPRACLDERPVLVEEYAACVRAKACPRPAVDPVANEPTGPYADLLVSMLQARCHVNLRNPRDLPANCVSWPQAEAYCHWKGRRLPSTEEIRAAPDTWLVGEWSATQAGDYRFYPSFQQHQVGDVLDDSPLHGEVRPARFDARAARVGFRCAVNR